MDDQLRRTYRSGGAVPAGRVSAWNSGAASLPTSFPGWWPVVVRGSSLGAEAWKPLGSELAEASGLRDAILVDVKVVVLVGKS